ncbi:MAG TPA: SpoIIE family protein phosphatase [Pseudobdellovibrionaceae bacterium]|nr:SpoIIE family protein phosphatase [Pseudobdellovibrionaceae bacterium]
MPEQADAENAKLRARVQELEDEVRAREADLRVFREQLLAVNTQLEKLIGQVAEDLKMAAAIQKVLIPTEFPNIPGFEFSSKFVPSPISGGDYFDIFEHEDRMRFGLVMAASSGYGMSSLLLSVLLKMTSSLEAKRGTAPEQVLLTLGQEMAPSLSEKDSASIFYAVVDRRTLEMHYTNVGRVFGGVLRAATGKFERLNSEDAALSAATATSPRPRHTLQLEARDRLFLATPGVAATKAANGEILGEERVFKAMLAAPRSGVHDWRNELLYQVEKHRGEIDLPQDVTVMVIEVKDRLIRLAPRRS